MKLLAAVLILGVCSQGLAFQCDAVFSGRVCGKYEKAGKSLVNAVEVTNKAMADAIIEIAQDASILFQTLIPSVANLDMKDQVIRLDKSTVIHIGAKMTSAEVKAMKDNMLAWLKNLANTGMLGQDELEKFTKAIDEALKGILSTSSNSYLVLDKVAEIREKIKQALSGLNFITRTLILKLVDRLHGRFDSLSTKVCSILTIVNRGDRCAAIKAKIDAIIASVTAKVASTAIAKSDAAIAVSEVHLFEMFEEIDKQTPIVKRGISDIWIKVKAAMEDLGIKISDKKIIEDFKPKIKKALGDAKKIVIDGVKKIIIQINDSIVKIVTDNATGTSQ